MFAARGLAVVIGAEHHASLLGPIYGAFLSLDIWVDRDDAEEAGTLLRDLRESDPNAAPTPNELLDRELARDQLADRDGGDEGAWAAGHDVAVLDAGSLGASDDADGSTDAMRARAYQRRRTVVALLCGMFFTFGTAHLFTGAWLRGLALAALELVGILHLASGHSLGIPVIVVAIALDVGGTLWRLWSQGRTRTWADEASLPIARSRKA
jgi:hypothetical protein